MMCTPPWGTSSTVASTGPKTLAMIRVTTEIAREIVGCDTPMISAIASWEVLVRKYINVARTAASGQEFWRQGDLSITQHHFHQAAQLRSVQACDTLTHDARS